MNKGVDKARKKLVKAQRAVEEAKRELEAEVAAQWGISEGTILIGRSSNRNDGKRVMVDRVSLGTTNAMPTSKPSVYARPYRERTEDWSPSLQHFKDWEYPDDEDEETKTDAGTRRRDEPEDQAD